MTLASMRVTAILALCAGIARYPRHQPNEDLMRFDPRTNVFLSDGALNHFAHMAYQDQLAVYFGRSRDALQAGDGVELVLCDAFIHCLHEHHGTALFDLDAAGLERLLLETLPRQVEVVATAATNLVTTLTALFTWLARVHRAPHAQECLAFLCQPGLASRLEVALDDEELHAFRPSMCVMSFDENAPLDDDLGLD